MPGQELRSRNADLVGVAEIAQTFRLLLSTAGRAESWDSLWQIIGVGNVVVDMTERKEAEAFRQVVIDNIVEARAQ